MPMPGFSISLATLAARLRRDERGIAAIEFAFALPVLVLLGVGITEIGRAINQAAAVDKSLRAAAYFAARQPRMDFPLTGPVESTVHNLVKYGSPDAGGDYVVSGWGKTGATLVIDTAGTFTTTDGRQVPLVRLSATVPFDPLLPGLLPIPNFNIRLSHEQTYIGD